MPVRTAVLVLARGAYGIALCVAPGALMGLAGGPPPSRRTRAVARLLGARHLVQAAITSVAPDGAVLLLGAEVDLLHAASMAGLAVLAPRRRRIGLADGLIAAALAADVLISSPGDAAGQAPGMVSPPTGASTSPE
jgi:hypothetical protein